MRVKFNLTIKDGAKVLAEVEGRERPGDALTVEDAVEGTRAVEALVEKLTGHRCHVNMQTIEGE